MGVIDRLVLGAARDVVRIDAELEQAYGPRRGPGRLASPLDRP